jgi:AcrR family transcriptional regulator
MKAFMERLAYDRFEDICVKEVCKAAEVAQGTFFNYFPEKIEVIAYYLRLSTMRMAWKAKKYAQPGKYLVLVDAIFDQIAEEWNTDHIVYQVLSVLARQTDRPKNVSIPEVEKKLAFPQCDGIEDVPSLRLSEWFKEWIYKALDNGELPAGVNADDVVVALMAIIGGTLLATRFGNNVDKRGYYYKHHLKVFWKGLGVRETKK